MPNTLSRGSSKYVNFSENNVLYRSLSMILYDLHSAFSDIPTTIILQQSCPA